MTGLSYKQIRDVKRLLEQNDAFITNRAGSYFNCLGMNVDLNGFYKWDKNHMIISQNLIKRQVLIKLVKIYIIYISLPKLPILVAQLKIGKIIKGIIWSDFVRLN